MDIGGVKLAPANAASAAAARVEPPASATGSATKAVATELPATETVRAPQDSVSVEPRGSKTKAGEQRGGSVCLNSFRSADKWFLPSVMPQPGLAAAH